MHKMKFLILLKPSYIWQQCFHLNSEVTTDSHSFYFGDVELLFISECCFHVLDLNESSQ